MTEMNCWPVAGLTLFLFSNILLAQVAQKTTSYNYIPIEIASKELKVPACTPLRAEISKNKVNLYDPNNVWGKISMSRADYDSVIHFSGFDDCACNVPAYKDRYTLEQLAALSKGQLTAGMPFEFALMILGPPNQKPMLFSMINPVTGKSESTTTYMWMHLYGSTGKLQSVFNIVGTVALGVSGMTNDIGTSINALKVADAAMTTDLVTWQVSSLSNSKIVTIQVDDTLVSG